MPACQANQQLLNTACLFKSVSPIDTTLTDTVAILIHPVGMQVEQAAQVTLDRVEGRKVFLQGCGGGWESGWVIVRDLL